MVMTLKLDFNEPVPNEDREKVINAFRALGLSHERVIQPGKYAVFRFYGRLPTISKKSDVDMITINYDGETNLKLFKNVDYVEIFVKVERKNIYE